MSIFSELKRRNVQPAGALYIGAAWALSQGVAQILPVFDIPNWVTRWFVIAVIIGWIDLFRVVSESTVLVQLKQTSCRIRRRFL